VSAGRRCASFIAALAAGHFAVVAAQASPACPEEQASPQEPTNLELCRRLEPIVRHPGDHPLNDYEQALNQYLGALCYRDEAAGWKVDKGIRDTGPWVGTYANGKWTGQYYGTHAPVMIWYSPDFFVWLKANRPEASAAPATAQPVPDGAIMVKEMYTAPAAACAGIEPRHLLPVKNGAAVMIRAGKVSHDGWFWGWYGYGAKSGWSVDWPAPSAAPYPNMGFGQYCVNCHASAADNQTFAALRNIKGEPGKPLVFLSQNFFLNPPWPGSPSPGAPLTSTVEPAPPKPVDHDIHTQLKEHRELAVKRAAARPEPADSGALDAIAKLAALNGGDLFAMPPATYDNVWVKPGAPPSSQFVTSDQCLGCHSAGGTGLQFDMTEPGNGTLLRNVSQYGGWRGSPMGLAGRDPVFFAQLASETEKFHPGSAAVIQGTCFGCHGVLGERQFAIDSGNCNSFTRAMVDAVPYPANGAKAKWAPYGGLARDGISCAACHHMVLGEKDSDAFKNGPQNKCVAERQAFLNPGLTKSAQTFTGSFFVGPADRLYGPFVEPKIKSMKNAIGVEPAHHPNVKSSELCGSCHTVHLPVMHKGAVIGHTYEQSTYPEWAFSAYRTGTSPDGPLPGGAGPLAQSCQDCHMPSKDPAGNPYRSKIASIQEYSNFPEAEHTLPPADIDLKPRDGFAKHTLVGLNLFLLKMAAQFPELLGLRVADPMLTKKGIDPVPAAEDAMIEQALNRTASVTIGDVKNDGRSLSARVTVDNKVGHKFPSGVGFRRAFIEFEVLDAKGEPLWASGRTNGAGVIVDEKATPIAGELWWKNDCSARIAPEQRLHQPHYQVITRQDQAQIYQELVAAPPEQGAPRCGIGAPPAGALTTSFLSICSKVKDNRLLPHGFLGLAQRKEISLALGAKDDMAEDTEPVGVADDPDYRDGGRDALIYRVPLAALADKAKPASVKATLYYQATPPFFLQDRFCTSQSTDTKRLYYMSAKLKLDREPVQDWKFRLVTSGPVAVP